MTYTTIELILYLILVDISVALALTAMYAWITEIALGILYGEGKVKLDNDFQTERLLSIFIVGIVPVVGFVLLGYLMWTLGDRVEAFTYSIRHIAKKKQGVIVLREIKTDIYNDWIFV